jgi:hypothetical protein
LYGIGALVRRKQAEKVLGEAGIVPGQSIQKSIFDLGERAEKLPLTRSGWACA